MSPMRCSNTLPMAACNMGKAVATGRAVASRFVRLCHSKQAKKPGATGLAFRDAPVGVLQRGRAPGFVGTLHHHVQQGYHAFAPGPVFAVALLRPGYAGLQQLEHFIEQAVCGTSCSSGWHRRSGLAVLASSAKPRAPALRKRTAPMRTGSQARSASPIMRSTRFCKRLQCLCGTNHHLRARVVVHGIDGEVTAAASWSCGPQTLSSRSTRPLASTACVMPARAVALPVRSLPLTCSASALVQVGTEGGDFNHLCSRPRPCTT